MKAGGRKIRGSTQAQLSLFLSVSLCFAAAQVPRLQTKNGGQFPTVVFSESYGRTTPGYYAIAIDSVGDAAFEYLPSADAQTGAPYLVRFTASAPVRERVFQLTRELKFFKLSKSEIQSAPSSENLAILQNHPIETLAFREASTEHEISYHDSRNPLLQQLTNLFAGIATTLDFGRQLTNLHESHSPELAAELKGMQDEASKGRLPELSAVAPVLQGIASDPKEDKEVRTRAEAILKLSRGE